MNDILHFLEGGYGGKKAFLNLYTSKIKNYFGGYYAYQNINFSIVKRLVFVCKGNISRSPYGHYKALSSGINAASFGLSAEPGKTADTQALSCSQIFDTSLSDHRATHISDFIFSEGDLILCFEPYQATTISQYLLQCRKKNEIQISLVGLWTTPKRPFIADPYGLHIQYYKTCYALINSAVINLKSKLP